MEVLNGKAAIMARDKLKRVYGSQLGRGNPADGIYRTDDGGQAEFFMDFGAHPRLVIYTPEEVISENNRPLSKWID